MLGHAIMARARLWVLPADHPAAIMRVAAQASPAPTWWKRIGAVMAGMPGGAIPDINQVEYLTPILSTATSCPAARKDVLRRYRLEVVTPALREYDRPSMEAAVHRVIPTFGMPFEDFMPMGIWSRPPEPDADFGGNLHYRLWAVCRLTGRWPLPVIGGEDAPALLQRCAACHSPEVAVTHAFTACAHTSALRRTLWSARGQPEPVSNQALLLALFGPEHNTPCVQFVGRALLRCMGPY